MPAAIYIYKKPTELKQARDRSDAVEREMKAAEALQTAKDEAKAAEKVKAAQDAKARHEAEAVELNHYLKYGESEIGAFFLVFLCLIFWWAQGYLEVLVDGRHDVLKPAEMLEYNADHKKLTASDISWGPSPHPRIRSPTGKDTKRTEQHIKGLPANLYCPIWSPWVLP
ncbi:hypothetical protein B0H12DRAFT_1244529 [Mycena haematopus]|nr:hypothetical protein B0H12DRAFT_1244529 [Mycena haematopus]